MVNPGRWRILAILFAVRSAMAFQFQSVAAVAPLLGRDLGVELADIGLLIGLYLAPGIALGLPGGAIGQRFGDKRTVLAGLVLMVVGGLTMALLPSWNAQIAGRLLAGVGGVLLNVLMSKMVTDWFGDRDIATAMGIFVNSWPAGIAVALVALPPIGAAYGVSAVFLVAVVLLVFASILLGSLYQAPAASGVPLAKASPGLSMSGAVVLAGLIWGLYNTGFAMIFSFGTSMLAERGLPLTAAGSITSIVLWLALVSVPLGGFLADWTMRPHVMVMVGCLASAALLLLAPRLEPIPVFVALGVVSGLPAGAIMSLPARVLAPSTRAVGMGLFYTVFYIGMGVGPTVGGWLATWAGSASAAFDFGAVMLAACPLALWPFHRLAMAISRNSAAVAAPGRA